jgi:hypothetical protein
MYTPDSIPNDCPPGLKAWLADQLRRIANELNTPAALLAQEPTAARDGMIVYARGPFAAALGAEGFYGREAGAWVKL